MNSANTYGLNKEVPLNPPFPFDVLAFSPETFGITHYSDAPPDNKDQ